ncbi:hypothetical protein PSACC_03559 [Paramicrosporidium saccamoebae]|uniref:Uncharacterized protein n=1 Tax=Paramicrosporidium saccamoebae TaxID=1246581 RepID=A0A2H9TFS4_9FUNG|nr:hypothetical protein PSACC_03559 [Paramicrosporidium saccamoebae]
MLEDVKKGKASWHDLYSFLDGNGSIDAGEEAAVVKMLTKGKGQDLDRAFVALHVCARNGEYGTELIPLVEKALSETNEPVLLGEVFTRFACALPSLIRLVYTSNNFDLWDVINGLRERILGLMKESSHAGVIIRGARMLQMFVLYCSNRSQDEDEMEEDEFSLDTLTLTDDSKIKLNDIKQVSSASLDQLIAILWRDNVPSNALLAVSNLLGRIARLRPPFLPKIVPALIELFETQPERLAEHQRLHLGHTLEKQLASLVECAAAEKYYSLIVEVLKKSTKYGKKRRNEEDDDESLLANVGTKKIKAEPTVEIEKVSLSTAIEVLLHALRLTPVERLRSSLERWRPTAHVQVRDPRRLDPRQPQIQASSVDMAVDQMVPFELAPRVIDEAERSQLLLNQYKAILEGMSDNAIFQDAKERKSQLKSLLRLAAVLENAVIGELLIDYWFVNLDERMAALLYWMRLVWLQADREKYQSSYALILARLQELAAENSPQWEAFLQRFLIETPEIVGDLHITLLDWLCVTPSTRTLTLAVIEQVSIKRPAVRMSLVTRLLVFCVSEDESLRKAATAIICDSLIELQDVSSLVSSAATDALNSIDPTVPGIQMDLVLRLIVRRPDIVFGKYFVTYNGLDAAVQEYCVSQLSLLCSMPDLEKSVVSLCNYLLQAPISVDPVGVWIEKTLEHLCRHSIQFSSFPNSIELFPSECMDQAIDNLLNDRWPIRLLELFAMVATKEQLKTGLVHYAEVVDPLEEKNKMHYVNLFSKAADLLGPSELFVFLHRLPVPLKRGVDVIQICFVMNTVFKPDTIATALQRLIDLPELPTMLMRTILQSAAHHKGLSSHLVGLLSRLLSRTLSPKLWDGFIRCLRTLAPSSYAVMLHLDLERLEEGLFGLFGSPPEITVQFEEPYDTYRRILSQGANSLSSSETCPIVHDKTSLRGHLHLRPKSPLDHLGISITLIGAIERTPPDEFISTRVQLAPPGTMKETTVLEFDFGNVRFPFPSYDGSGVSLRYFVRVVMHRKLSDVVKEATLWCPTVYEPVEMSPSVPVEIEVGLEEFLHIKMRLDRSHFLMTDEIHGTVQFLLVRVRVIDVAVTLVRKELDGNNEVIEQTILSSRQILDGSAYRGDVLPVYLDLAALGTKASPTMNNINGTFSVRYYVGLVLRDAENRKYYKQVEIMLRRPERSVLYPVLPDYRLGLAVQ